MEKGLIPISDRVLAEIADVKIDHGTRALILRRRLKLTLTEIAEITGLHEHRLSEMERGLRGVDPVYAELLEKKSAA